MTDREFRRKEFYYQILRQKAELNRRRRQFIRLQKIIRQNMNYNYHILLNGEIIYDSLLACRKGVSWKRSPQFHTDNRIAAVASIISDLSNGILPGGSYAVFKLNERGKERIISSPTYLERVVQHALCNHILIPTLMPSLIYDSGASVKGKGISFARKRFVKHLTQYYHKYGSNKGYVLQIDFRKYFDSIDHDILMKKVAKKIPCAHTLALLRQIIDKHHPTTGLALGSNVSQILALVHLSRLDHYIKRVLGIKYYGRYMDDSYIIAQTKEELEIILAKISKICDLDKIVLNTKKTKIVPISEAITFLKCKYTLCESGFVRKISGKESSIRERRKLKKFKELLDTNSMTPFDICNQYKSWRNFNLKDFHSYSLIQRMDMYFYNIFGFEYNTYVKLNKTMESLGLQRL